MKYLLLTILLAGLCVRANAQTTISNIDDQTVCDQNPNPPDPYGNPDCYNTNLQEWAWISEVNDPGGGIGCESPNGCHVTGNMSQGCVYCLDGQSLQMNIVNPGETCSPQPGEGCYSDVQFMNRLYTDDTASGAGYLTTDMWATTDSTGTQDNENLEYSLEQDVTDPSPGTSDRYVYGLSCNNLDNGSIWQVWWGDYVNQGGSLGEWTPATWNGGQTIPCLQFYPTLFTHLIFHFQQVNNSNCNVCTKYIDFTVVQYNPNDPSCSDPNTQQPCVYYYPLDSNMIFGGLAQWPNWGAGLITAMQLDGDWNDDQYSVWADNWAVCYAPPGPTNPCSN